MAVWSEVYASMLNIHLRRIDAEFYRPESLNADKLIKSKPYCYFGSVVSCGYRVVYENTKILRKDSVTENDCRFLQATNINSNGLTIGINDVGFVKGSEWLRYPKGRIQKGELLIEVKGQAEKVAIVPEDYPLRTLVSGSLYKAKIKEGDITPEFIFAFFNCTYGRVLRDRTKTNTLIGFVSKPELYSIPIPIPNQDVLNEVTFLVKKAIENAKNSEQIHEQAQKLLEAELGLDKLAFEKPMGYEASLSEVISGRRIDAQCYNPEAVHYEKYLRANSKYDRLRDIIKTMTKGKQMDSLLHGNVHYVSIKNIDGTELITSEYCVSNEKTRIAQRNDLLLAITGATIGKVGIVHRYDNLAFSGDLLALTPSNGIHPHYLLTVLQSAIGQSQCQRWITGSTNGHLAPHDVAKLIIPRLDQSTENMIGGLIEKSLAAKQESEQLLEQAKARIEQLIEQMAQAC